MERVILLTGFGPFGGERINPSWEVAERFEGNRIGGAVVKTLKLPVHCQRAAHQVMDTVARIRPAAVIGLGQAGGRPVLSLEKVAVNLADEHAAREAIGVANGKRVVTGGPDAYFSRLPLASILQALRRRNIPVELSLSAGVYVCNSMMYATLHALRRRPRAKHNAAGGAGRASRVPLPLLRNPERPPRHARRPQSLRRYFIATAFGGDAIPPTRWSGTDTSMNS